MLKLGVNIDHVATLREARYHGRATGEPDPVEAARICEEAGAHGITVHLREDRRHIQDRDVVQLRKTIRTRLNLEMANSAEILAFALKVKPEIVCLVPERRQEVTTEGGLDAAGQWRALRKTREKLNGAGIEVSLFIGPDPDQIEASARIGAQFIELHTGAFAEHFRRSKDRKREVKRLVNASRQADSLGLQVNAGHGLNYTNVGELDEVPHLVELNIGHSIVSRAITVGLGQAVREMLEAMEGYGDEIRDPISEIRSPRAEGGGRRAERGGLRRKLCRRWVEFEIVDLRFGRRDLRGAGLTNDIGDGHRHC